MVVIDLALPFMHTSLSNGKYCNRLKKFFATKLFCPATFIETKRNYTFCCMYECFCTSRFSYNSLSNIRISRMICKVLRVQQCYSTPQEIWLLYVSWMWGHLFCNWFCFNRFHYKLRKSSGIRYLVSVLITIPHSLK